MFIKVCGCRGSAPLSRSEASKYGGNTTCFKFTSGGAALIADAGSGMLTLEDLPVPVNILLGHLHFDHIIGLATYPPVWARDCQVRLFTQSRSEANIKSQVLGAFTKPYWPAPLDKVSGAEVIPVVNGEAFCPDGTFTVTSFPANHPDGASSFKITDGSRTVVYMLDYEMETLPERERAALFETCAGADLVVFDATYHPDDYVYKRGYGHSTVNHGVELADGCGCKRVLFTHYSFEYTDEDLDKWRELLANVKNKERFIFARDGLEIEI